MWCLGNERDGPWQTGHKTAAEYGRLAAETARAMRQIDDSLELVACGSSSQAMEPFAAREATVLAETYDLVDHLSLHAYYEEVDGDRDSFLASAVDMESFIRNVIATCDHVGARLKSPKRINLSFDEWNVWYMRRFHAQTPLDWEEAPRLLEDNYSVTDAVVFGSLLIALLRHADRVTVACLRLHLSAHQRRRLLDDDGVGDPFADLLLAAPGRLGLPLVEGRGGPVHGPRRPEPGDDRRQRIPGELLRRQILHGHGSVPSVGTLLC